MNIEVQWGVAPRVFGSGRSRGHGLLALGRVSQ